MTYFEAIKNMDIEEMTEFFLALGESVLDKFDKNFCSKLCGGLCGIADENFDCNTVYNPRLVIKTVLESNMHSDVDSVYFFDILS